MKGFFIALLACLALAFISGCVQPPIASTSCSGVAQDRLANCIYVHAVEEQNPYYCYEMPKERPDVRKACIADASDYSMKKALDRMIPSERDMLYVEAPSAANPASPEGQAATTGAGTEPGATTNSTTTPNMTDNEAYSAAVASKQITMCEAISDQSMHNSCISQIAQKTKNVTSCAALALPADQDLCSAYAQG